MVNHFLRLFILTITLSSTNSYADINNEELIINADNQDLDYQNNTLHFNGNVVVTQHNITMKAKELFVSTENGNGDKLVATGTPATFTQTFEDDDELIAKANKITYIVDKQILKLNGNATFEQGGSVVRSGTIEFDLSAKLVKADGDQSTGGRVTTTLKTKKLPALETDKE